MKKEIIAVAIVAILIPLFTIGEKSDSIPLIILGNMFYILFPTSLLLLLFSYYSWKEKKNIWKIELNLSYLMIIISWLFLLSTVMINLWEIDPTFFVRLAYFSIYAITSGLLMRKAKQINKEDGYWKSLRVACILSGVGIPIAFFAAGVLIGSGPTCYIAYMPPTKSPPEILAAPVYAWRKHKLKQKIKKEGKI